MEKSPPFPATMRAWTHSRAGVPSTVLSLSFDIPTPTIKDPNDVLIRISHASLSPGASIMMQLCPFCFRSKLAIAELDFSGTLVAAGSAALESDRLAIGDSYFGTIGPGSHIKTGSGALAEYVVVPAANVTRKPITYSTDAEASGLGVSGCTALALMQKAGLQNGNSVLVNGASGGIGSMVVQMARDAVGTNGQVVAICSGANAEMVKELGANEVRPLQLRTFSWDQNFRTRRRDETYSASSYRSSTTKNAIQSLSISRHATLINDSMPSSMLTASKNSTAFVVIISAQGSPSLQSASRMRSTRTRASFKQFSR